MTPGEYHNVYSASVRIRCCCWYLKSTENWFTVLCSCWLPPKKGVASLAWEYTWVGTSRTFYTARNGSFWRCYVLLLMFLFIYFAMRFPSSLCRSLVRFTIQVPKFGCQPPKNLWQKPGFATEPALFLGVSGYVRWEKWVRHSSTFSAHISRTHSIPTEKPVGIPTESPYP